MNEEKKGTTINVFVVVDIGGGSGFDFDGVGDTAVLRRSVHPWAGGSGGGGGGGMRGGDDDGLTTTIGLTTTNGEPRRDNGG